MRTRKYIKEKQKPNKTGNRILNGRHVVSVISETEWIVELIAGDLNLSRLVRAPRVRSVNRRAGRNTRRPQKDDQFNKKRTAAVLFKHISLAPGSFFLVLVQHKNCATCFLAGGGGARCGSCPRNRILEVGRKWNGRSSHRSRQTPQNKKKEKK